MCGVCGIIELIVAIGLCQFVCGEWFCGPRTLTEREMVRLGAVLGQQTRRGVLRKGAGGREKERFVANTHTRSDVCERTKTISLFNNISHTSRQT
jgi:hypothetical protein